ncbi:TrmB family transcriptional regulator [Cuniculiplasma divulgatum]|jgi:sugar-specific transcriptional regulator TrmB|uniref:TrmB family transcriptional regulator n=1 Tax=Cuniculiplasma divulgatum TaxID=1673428 RepID=A0A1N5W800_9ARCH|nr:TrmB family transcriptional regulator [Cuniculiplasma divulgatum]
MNYVIDLDSDTFRDLEKFQLSNYEIKAYSSLLLKGPMRASEIIKVTGIPQPRTYDVLGKLQRKGLIIMNSSINKTYEAIMPSAALRHNVEYMNEYIDRLDKYILENRSDFEIRAPNVWFIENSKSVMLKLELMISESNSEIILSMEYHKLAELLPALRRARKRGVTICSVMKESIDEKSLVTLSELGILRIRSIMPVEIVVVDRKIAFLNANSLSQTSDYSIFIQEEELVDVLDYYFFNMNWVSSRYYRDFDGMENVKISSSWLACELIDNAFSKGYKCKVEVEGFDASGPVSLNADVISVKRIQGLQYAFVIKTITGTYTVGGKNATLEDIKMVSGVFNFEKE